MKTLKKLKKICPKIKRAYLLSEKFYKYRLKYLIFSRVTKNKSYSINPNYTIVDNKFITINVVIGVLIHNNENKQILE